MKGQRSGRVKGQKRQKEKMGFFIIKKCLFLDCIFEKYTSNLLTKKENRSRIKTHISKCANTPMRKQESKGANAQGSKRAKAYLRQRGEEHWSRKAKRQGGNFMQFGPIVTTVINQKGGVAKTTTCAELAYNLKTRGYEVALVDMDPSANLSVAMLTPEMLEQLNEKQNPYPDGTAYEALKQPHTAFEPAGARFQGPVYKVSGGVDMIPAPPNKMLANAEGELLGIPAGREHMLEEVLRALLARQHYDFVFIDTPPSLGVLSINALTASDLVLVPCVAEPYSVQGVMDLNDTVTVVKKYSNPGLKYAGVLMTRIKQRTRVHAENLAIMETCCKALGINMFDVRIHESVDVPGAQGRNQSLAGFKAGSAVTKQYDDFVNEFLEVVKNV